MRSEEFGSTKEFAAATREYITLLKTMSKISGVRSALRAEQKKTAESLQVCMMQRGKKEHVCGDMTRLTLRTSVRRSPMKKDYVLAELLSRFSAKETENIWKGIVDRRPIVETEKLAYESEGEDDSD